jgi:hypothetical protein
MSVSITTSASNGKKIGRNDPCPCESGKKYKVCCMETMTSGINYNEGQAEHTEAIDKIISTLKEECPKISVIDITGTLNSKNYRPYQLSNYNKNIAMVAEKTPENEEVFSTRTNMANSDIIIMYKGAYRTFPKTLFRSMLTSILLFLSGNNNL